MSDAPPAPPPPPSTPTADVPPAAGKPAKKPGILRPSGIILLVLLVLGGWLSAPWVIEPWLIRQIESTLTNRGLEIGPQTRWDLKLFNGKLRADDLDLSETYEGETRTVLAATTLEIDLGLLGMLGGDVIIDSLIATGVSGDFRRRGDGTVPMTPPDESGEGIDWSTVDWFDYLQRAYRWWDERDRAAKEARKDPDAQKKKPPVAKRDPSWEDSRRYEPDLPPGHGPRVLIRHLELTGAGVKLPDASVFEIAAFSLNGSNVCVIQLDDEHMTLRAELTTVGTGPVVLDLKRLPGDDGSLTLTANAVPVAALADPKLSGDALARYQPSGTTDIDLSATWSAAALDGGLTSAISGFDFVPPADDRTAQQLHQVTSRLGGRPLTWPIRFGGSLRNPRITDSGVDELIKGSLADAAKDAVKEEATRRAAEEAAKQLEANPELQRTTDRLRNVLGK